MVTSPNLDRARVSAGASGVPRWLVTPDAAALIAGVAVAPDPGVNPYDHVLRPKVLVHLSGGTALSDLQHRLDGLSEMRSGMLGYPAWDIASGEDSPVLAVEQFGGATSQIAVFPARSKAKPFGPVTLPPGNWALPRFVIRSRGKDPMALTARHSTDTPLVILEAGGTQKPIADGRLALCLDDGAARRTFFLTAERGLGASPLGQASGRLHVSGLEKSFGGAIPLAKAGHLAPYDFDAAFDASGHIHLLCAAPNGLHLLTLGEDGVTDARCLVNGAVLHPALHIEASSAYAAFNTMDGHNPGPTDMVHVPLS